MSNIDISKRDEFSLLVEKWKKDKSVFPEVVDFTIKSLGVDKEIIVQEFEIPTEIITWWIHGVSKPHLLMQEMFIEFIDELINNERNVV